MTVLAERKVRYPFSVQAPLGGGPNKPHGVHVFVQSISGGIFGGDDLCLSIEADRGAEVRIEVPTATVVHTMRDSRTGAQRIVLDGHAASILDYVPPPQILFPGCRLQQQIHATVAPDAHMLIGDGFAMHDPSQGGEAFDWLETEIRVGRPDGRLVIADRSRVRGGAILAGTPGVTGTCRATATLMLLAPVDPDGATGHCRTIQAVLDETGVYSGATPLRQNSGILVRILARDGGALLSAQAGLLPLLRGCWMIEFRAAQESDLPAIVRLLADDDLGRGRERVDSSLAPAYLEAFRQMGRQEGNHLLVAVTDGRIVGCMQVTILHGLSRMGATRALLEGVRVERSLRGRGIGAAMIQNALGIARVNACTLVQLTSDQRRVDARRFYERLGFVASHVGMKLDLAHTGEDRSPAVP